MAKRQGYHWRHVVCEGCLLRCRYRDFKVFGKDAFQEVQETFWKESDDPEDWVYKSRSAILGRLHQWKREAWEEKIQACPGIGVNDARKSSATDQQESSRGLVVQIRARRRTRSGRSA